MGFWKLFARKGNRCTAVAAVARKLAVQVWHVLSGNPPEALERDKSFDTKLGKLACQLGKSLRKQLSMPATIKDSVVHLRQMLLSNDAGTSTA